MRGTRRRRLAPRPGTLARAAARLLILAAFGGPAVAGPIEAVPQAAAGEILRLGIDPARSAIEFTISRPGETIQGRAHAFSGEVMVNPRRPAAGASVVLRVESASLETGNRVRDRKMRNSHLEVDRFPVVLFRSASIRVSRGASDDPAATASERKPVASGANGATSAPDAEPGPLLPGEPRRALLEGTLSLHGVDRTILLPATIRYDTGALTAEGDLIIKLTDHQIPLPRFLWIVLDDDVKVHFRLVAAPASPAAPAGSSGAGGAPAGTVS